MTFPHQNLSCPSCQRKAWIQLSGQWCPRNRQSECSSSVWPGLHLWQTHSLVFWPAVNTGGGENYFSNKNRYPFPRQDKKCSANQVTDFFCCSDWESWTGKYHINCQTKHKALLSNPGQPSPTQGENKKVLENVNTVGKSMFFYCQSGHKRDRTLPQLQKPQGSGL